VLEFPVEAGWAVLRWCIATVSVLVFFGKYPGPKSINPALANLALFVLH
jgi:hypothetical protein